MEDYVGFYENAAYGIIKITQKDTAQQFTHHHISLPLYHFHYDRFDTPNDEEDGLFSLNFGTYPQCDIDRFAISLDEGEAIFIKKPDISLSDFKTLSLFLLVCDEVCFQLDKCSS